VLRKDFGLRKEKELSMDPISNILASYPAVILDGALATELERRGCNLKDKLWSAKVLLETPELIRQVHLDYYMAGADCAITASYQATIEGLSRRGLNEKEAIELIQSSVRLAVEARDEFWKDEAHRVGRPRPFVAASVGPYGAYLADGSEYSGDYGLTETQLMDFHRPRMKALIETDADILACETIPCLVEAQALTRLLKEFPNVSAWISFSCRDEAHVCHGEKLEDCVRLVSQSPQVAAVGVNCTSPTFVSSLIREVQKATDKPILVYPNSGETYDAASHAWDGRPVCDSFADQAKEWVQVGARGIGGCCRTTPDDIRAVAGWARPVK
jgi:homocysteine S-methyltransferase